VILVTDCLNDIQTAYNANSLLRQIIFYTVELILCNCNVHFVLPA